MRDLELKFYKKLGIRKFRDILIKTVYLLFLPFFIIFKVPKEKRKNTFYKFQTNYFMEKGNGLKDLKSFKKWLYINAGIHIYALVPCIRSLLTGTFIIEIPFIILNLYCIMLQRYNYIRIDNTIKKYEDIEKKKICSIKEEIKDNIEETHISIYSPKKKINESDKTLDNVLDNLSLKSLRELKKLIETKQICNNKYLYATFKEKEKKYKINTKVKAKKI